MPDALDDDVEDVVNDMVIAGIAAIYFPVGLEAFSLISSLTYPKNIQRRQSMSTRCGR